MPFIFKLISISIQIKLCLFIIALFREKSRESVLGVWDQLGREIKRLLTE